MAGSVCKLTRRAADGERLQKEDIQGGEPEGGGLQEAKAAGIAPSRRWLPKGALNRRRDPCSVAEDLLEERECRIPEKTDHFLAEKLGRAKRNKKKQQVDQKLL